MKLTKNISKIDAGSFLESWNWRFESPVSVVLISVIGDLFLRAGDGSVHWLQTDGGELKKVADSIEQFKDLLKDADTTEDWFLPGLVEQLEARGLLLQADEVYSPKQMVALGGPFVAENYAPSGMSVHFHLTGSICRQIKDLPDGTPINAIKLVW